MRHLVVEEAARVERAVAVELVERAVQLVRPAPERHRDDAAAEPPVLGRVAARRDPELADRVDRRARDRLVAAPVDVRDPVDQVVDVVGARAVDVVRVRARRRRHDPRREEGEVEVVTAVEREVENLAAPDRRAEHGRLGLDRRRLVGHDHRLGDRPRLEHGVDANLLLDLDRHAVTDEGLEPRHLGRHAVAPRRELWHDVAPLRRRAGLDGDVRLEVRRDDAGAGDDGARRVGDGADDLRLVSLCGERRRRQKQRDREASRRST
jgi:hypothetical protein